ncbi:hypothetical protein [Actinoplanes palleronii]|uniref:Uncharacterized protein n=1 Tax=Actinoplanes palleronii TaxID=113570 RepID=A0ABQ4BDA4_9ACTN|nr:hypothetical protein [Actinoplanes palleronii]GIE68658.1 hypothetical protein Apa02nite_047660 [Actinoplanes palleronii]
MTDARAALVDIEQTDGRVVIRVLASGSTTVAVVERVRDPKLHPHIPIGTRERQHLRMMLDDIPVHLDPGPGRYSRHSYRVVVEHEGHSYVYRPKTPDTSRLTRDGWRLGDFTITAKGELDADWHEEAAPEPVDVAIGYALGAAFGAGADFFLVSMLNLVDQADPGH